MYTAKREYSVKPPLNYDFIKRRVFWVLHFYDKIDQAKVLEKDFYY